MNRQHERIAQYISEFGGITPMEAFADLGITKLATRISEMRRAGMDIRGKMVQSRNRFGETTRYMRYEAAK